MVANKNRKERHNFWHQKYIKTFHEMDLIASTDKKMHDSNEIVPSNEISFMDARWEQYDLYFVCYVNRERKILSGFIYSNVLAGELTHLLYFHYVLKSDKCSYWSNQNVCLQPNMFLWEK